MKGFIAGFMVAAVTLAGGFSAYTRWAEHTSGMHAEEAATQYYCPMHPAYVADEPGNCPICNMKLAPVAGRSRAPSPSADPHAGHQMGPAGMPGTATEATSAVPGYTTVMIPQERMQVMGIALAEARRMDLDQNIRTVGRITYDETKVHHVHTKFEGFVEDLYVNYVGQFVEKGQPLFSIYSPELYATQNEYLLALRAREEIPLSGGSEPKSTLRKMEEDLLAAARQRLALWDIGADQIRELEKTRRPFRALMISSPVSGYVTVKTALQGLRVMPGESLYDIVDLSTVWAQADIYEVDLPFVKLGQPASLTLTYQPGKTWRGRVAFINPTVDPTTRTIKARIEFANPNGELKPEMYADVLIGGTRGSGLAIPESAVIATGERNVVFIAKGGGVFEPREVVLGVKVRDLHEVKQGISEGEHVVAGANFLLDSESKLKASMSAAGGHKHGS